MSNAVSVDIKDLLVAAGIGAFGGTAPFAIYIGREPAAPDDCVTIYDTPGAPAHAKFKLDFPRFQIRVRSAKYLTGYAKAQAAKDALMSYPSQTFNGTWYVGIWNMVDTFLLRTDEAGRSVFLSNWRVIREPTTGTYRETL